MIDKEQAKKVAEDAALSGGKVLMTHLGKITMIQEKSTAGDLVTEADKKSEDVIKKILKENFPTHDILSEEFGMDSVEKSDYLWAVDPLDGTTNYTHCFPMFSVSIALLYKGMPIVAVVYHPVTEEMFSAAAGNGAFLNGEKIQVSKTEGLNRSLLATGFAYDRRDTPDNNYLEFCYITSLCQGVRRAGSAALDLAYVACGRFDGFWERGLQVWDIAAGSLLIIEAGGNVSSYENGPLELTSGRILASNGKIHQIFSDELIGIRKKKNPIIF